MIFGLFFDCQKQNKCRTSILHEGSGFHSEEQNAAFNGKSKAIEFCRLSEITKPCRSEPLFPAATLYVFAGFLIAEFPLCALLLA